MDTPKLIELARTCLAFGRVDRVTYHADGVTPESDTDHTVMLGIVGCAFAERMNEHRFGGGETFDIGLVAQFALVHDFVEVYAGDTDTAGISQQGSEAKEVREKAAFYKLRQLFDDAYPWLTTAIQDYENLNCPEARFVKALDKVLPKITHLINEGVVLAKRGFTRDKIREMNNAQLAKIRATYAADQPEVLELYELIQAELLAMMEKIEKPNKVRPVNPDDCYRGCLNCDGSPRCSCVGCHS